MSKGPSGALKVLGAIGVGVMIGGGPVVPFLDLVRSLVVFPLIGGLVGAALAANRIKKRKSPEYIRRTRKTVFVFSVVALVVGPLLGGIFFWTFIPLGVAASIVVSLALAVAAIILGPSGK
jgi:hypothetical protein